MLLRLIPLVMMVGVAAAASGTVNVTAAYTSNWDDVRLVQDGTTVRGTYVCCGGGTIEGRIYEGRVIRYTWTQPSAHGQGVWEITRSGRLEGTWGFGQSDDDGGRWDLERKSSLAN